ncbi:MAG: translation initiation factor IF-3 [Nitrospinae bacterium]|nr:translation initiation factor IF-3 [Nitrospinota bacterium]
MIVNDKDGLRVNLKIRAPEVTVIDDLGVNLGHLSVPEAVAMANARGFDLVEVGAGEKPPVCRFMDYGKFKYRKNKKAHEAKRNQKIIKIKEVKITPRTSEHDYLFKLAHTQRFIGEGNKAKITVFFKGRQIDHKELGMIMLNRFMEDTKEYAVIGHPPTLEGRAMSMILEPKGKGKHATAPVPDTAVQAAMEKIIKGDKDAQN